MMIFLNAVRNETIFPKEYAEGFLKLLAPIAPHLCEEIWQMMGNEQSISLAEWPSFDPELTVDDQVEIVVQINGKVKVKMMIEKDLAVKQMEENALNHDLIQKELADKTIKKVIAIPNRLVNIVAN